jgi:hypothetical protein
MGKNPQWSASRLGARLLRSYGLLYLIHSTRQMMKTYHSETTKHGCVVTEDDTVGVNGARADDVETEGGAGAASGDMPVAGADVASTLNAEDAAAAESMISEGGH